MLSHRPSVSAETEKKLFFSFVVPWWNWKEILPCNKIDVVTLFSIIWLVIVLGACSFFIWFMTDRVMYLVSHPKDRVMYLVSHPKAVDVEVIYTDSVLFPAVTICNQNLFRFLQ